MVGKQVLTISAADFAKGSSSSDYAQDGGFSPLSSGLNLNIKQGVVYSTPAPTDASANVAGVFIASCPNNGAGISSNRRNFLDSSANFYSLSGTTITKQATGTKTYTYGLSDMISFQNIYYASSINDVTQWSGTTITSETWFSVNSGTFGSLGNYPHPMIVYNKKLWIADGNYLHSFDGTTIVTEALIFDTNQVIYALGIDPGTGQMLISTSLGPNASLSNPQLTAVWLFDGASSRPSRFIPTNDMALSFHSIGESVFVGMSRGIGIWTGAGIQMIHQFLNVGYDANFLPYKMHITNIGNILYFVDGKQIFAYGEVQQVNNIWMRQVKVFYPCFQPITGAPVSSYIGLIANVGSGALGVFYQTATPTNEFAILDMTTAGSGGSLRSNRYEFPRPVVIHRIRVFTTGITNNTTGGQVGIYNDESNNTIVSASSQMGIASGTQYRFDFDFGGTKLQMAQFFANIAPSGLGINRMVVYYDVAE